MIDLLRSALPDTVDDQPLAAVERDWLVQQAVAGLAEARRAPSFAAVNLAKWFRKNRSLGSRDRRLVSDLVYDAIRHEAILLRSGARSPEDLIRGAAAISAGERFPSLEGHSAEEDLATALNVPGPVASEWLQALGEEGAAQLAASINQRPPVDIRVNTLKTTREILQADLAEEGIETQGLAELETHLEVIGRANLLATSAFRAGHFEVQDRASQAMCAALDVRPGMTIVDLCAGAGGKSLALAARGAVVHATDIRSRALDELKKRSDRAGARVEIVQPSEADLVLVDAPCSGSGRIRRNPAIRWGLTDQAHLATQAQLMEEAAAFVRPGGTLVYATCSLLARENAHPTPPGFDEASSELRWPHVHGSDGFYWRVMVRS